MFAGHWRSKTRHGFPDLFALEWSKMACCCRIWEKMKVEASYKYEVQTRKKRTRHLAFDRSRVQRGRRGSYPHLLLLFSAYCRITISYSVVDPQYQIFNFRPSGSCLNSSPAYTSNNYRSSAISVNVQTLPRCSAHCFELDYRRIFHSAERKLTSS